MDPLHVAQTNKLPFAELLGVEYVAASKDEVVAELAVRDELCTRPEILHGGAVIRQEQPIQRRQGP